MGMGRPARCLPWLLGLAAIGWTMAVARGEGPPESTCGVELDHLPTPAEWTLDVVPYAWAPWVNGWETVAGRTVDIHSGPIQELVHLRQMPVMMYLEARRGPVGVYGDIIYGNVGLDGSAVRTRPSRSLSAALGIDGAAFIGEIGGVYEIAEWQSGDATTSLDLLGGARVWHQEADLKLAITETLDIHHLVIHRDFAVAQSGAINWIDPLVGARIRRRVRDGNEIYLRGDVGGFGAGSQFTWNITAAYAFELCAGEKVTYTGLIGYRLLDVDYTRGHGYSLFTFDALMQGPLLGLAIGF